MVGNYYRFLFFAMVLFGSAPVIGSCKTRHFQNSSIESSNDPEQPLSIEPESPKEANNSLVEILTKAEPSPVACLVFKELQAGKFTLIRTNKMAAFFVALYPSHSQAKKVDAELGFATGEIGLFPLNFSLKSAIGMTRRAFGSSLRHIFDTDGKRSKASFSFPVLRDNQTIDIGGTFRSVATTEGLVPAKQYPPLPRILRTDINETAQTNTTIRPSDHPNVLLLNLNDEEYALICAPEPI